MMCARRLSPRAGLTLAELLIALIIGGMTLVITAQASTSVRRWTARLAEVEKDNTKAVGLYQFAETILSDALPITQKVEDQTLALFEGSPHSVRFVRVEPGYPARAGIYQYYLFGQKGENGQWSLNLERELLSNPDQFGTMTAPARLNLYSDDQAPVFVYMGASGWQTQWRDKETPPLLVSFAIADWPSLSIAVPQPGQLIELEKKNKKKKPRKSQNNRGRGAKS
ncbi:MAG: hypothetical protein COA84_10835 [Robiginitomaculum sp.]|nr:MAG: hypothetical protein COA84_10835 [Robiginitomaculum sp.]